MPKSNSAFELNDLLTVLNSAGFRNLLDEHKKSLQKEVNLLLGQLKFTEAYGELCRLNDIDRIIGLIENRVNELKPKEE